MKKWLMIILLILLMIPTATALLDCQDTMTPREIPCTIISSWEYTNCSLTTIKIYNSIPTLLQTKNFTDFGTSGRCNITWNISTKGSYFWNVSNGDTGRLIIEHEVDRMAGLAITVFILIITGAIFLLSMKKDILRNKYANLVVRRSLLVLGIYLMILNSAIMATIAENAGLQLTQEMFFFMRLFGYIGYPAILFLMLSTLIQSLREMKIDKRNKRTGEEYGET